MTLHKYSRTTAGQRKKIIVILDNLHYQQGFVIKLKKDFERTDWISNTGHFVMTELDAKMYDKCEHALPFPSLCCTPTSLRIGMQS